MSDLLSQISPKLKDVVFRFALRLLGNKEDAKDITQDILEKLWKKRKKMESCKNIEALSIKMTRDLCMDRLRHQTMKRGKLKMIRNEIEHLYQKTEYDVVELAQITKELINKLPDKQRMIIHLRDVEQYEFEEIREILGMEIQAIRMNLSRARRTIKEQLEKITNYGIQ